MDSRVLRDQQLNKRMQQCFASLSGVVHKLETTEGQGELLLGNAPMGAQPAPQQRPEPFHRMHMDFTNTIAIFLSGLLASSLVHALMVVSPGTQAGINTVRIRINKCTWNDGVFDERLHRLVLHIDQQIDHPLTTPLYHAQDGWPFFLQCASATFAFELASTPFSSLHLHHLRLSFMASNHIGFVALHLI